MHARSVATNVGDFGILVAQLSVQGLGRAIDSSENYASSDWLLKDSSTFQDATATTATRATAQFLNPKPPLSHRNRRPSTEWMSGPTKQKKLHKYRSTHPSLLKIGCMFMEKVD